MNPELDNMLDTLTRWYTREMFDGDSYRLNDLSDRYTDMLSAIKDTSKHYSQRRQSKPFSVSDHFESDDMFEV